MVFDRVISEVCETSKVDFEEGGVDQQTLEDMKMVSLFLCSCYQECSQMLSVKELSIFKQQDRYKLMFLSWSGEYLLSLLSLPC